MDAFSRIRLIRDHAKQALEAGTMDGHAYRHLHGRATLLLERAVFLRRRRTMPMWRVRDNLVQLRRLQTILKTGGTITAIDTGYRGGWDITEAGIATFRAGSLTVRNIVRDDALYRIDPTIPHPNGIPSYTPPRFVGGASEIMNEADLIDEATLAYERADVVVWHTSRNDRACLCLPVSDDKSVDLYEIGFLHRSRGSLGLVAMCEQHGVKIEEPHCSGNDALMTLNCALAIGDKRISGWERGNIASLREHEIKTRHMMKPTRLRKASVIRRAESRIDRALELEI